MISREQQTNVLLPSASWERVRDDILAMDRVTPVLFDDDQLLQVDGSAADASIHMAWHNFELPRSSVRPFAKLLLESELLELVQTAAAGLDAPFFSQLLERGVTLCNSDAQSLSIAEYVVASLLNVYHDFPARKQLQGEQRWARHPFQELAGKHCLLIGYGNIGAKIADRLKAFEVSFTVLRREQHPIAGVDTVGGIDEIERHLPSADIVVLACSLNEATHGLLNASRLGVCRPGSVVVNIARGALIDESALLAELDGGRLAHAVLDVFQEEPLPKDSPLWDHTCVTVSAHCSNFGSGRERRGDDLFLHNLRAYLSGTPFRNRVRSSGK
ncbi:MAG: D-2-hydroxyacid dehydrogenase [Pseudomonadota bacterium]